MTTKRRIGSHSLLKLRMRVLSSEHETSPHPAQLFSITKRLPRKDVDKTFPPSLPGFIPHRTVHPTPLDQSTFQNPDLARKASREVGPSLHCIFDYTPAYCNPRGMTLASVQWQPYCRRTRSRLQSRSSCTTPRGGRADMHNPTIRASEQSDEGLYMTLASGNWPEDWATRSWLAWLHTMQCRAVPPADTLA